MNGSGCNLVEVIPGKVSGAALLRGTRVAVDQILASLDAGESVEDVAHNFDLNTADILALQSFR
jgi:uncharacterized protein (DUF433 family)